MDASVNGTMEHAMNETLATPSLPVTSSMLAAKSDAVCRMGALMLSAGTGSYRVKAAMGRVSQALGLEAIESQVGLNEIVVTTREGGLFRTQIIEVPVPGVNADRIAALLRVSLRARPGLTADELQDELDFLEGHAHHHAQCLVILGAAIACGAFAFLNNGRWQECTAALVAAGLGKFLQITLRRTRMNQLATIAIAAGAASFVYVMAAAVLRWTVPGAAASFHDAAFTSAILFLVPGFPLITAGLDLARFDFTAGISRMLYAFMVLFAASLGAWLVAWGFGLVPQEIPPVALPVGAMLALRAVASFLGILGFAISFNTPLKPALATSALGMLANVMRLGLNDAHVSPVISAMMATTLVGFLAGWVCQRLAAPRIILSVPAVLIMIPGAPTYRALVGVINRDPLPALSNGFFVIGVVVALVTGLVIARMITDPAWVSARPDWTHMPSTRAQRIVRSRQRS